MRKTVLASKFCSLLMLMMMFVFIPVSAWGNVPIDAVHFPDSEFRLWMTQWDYGWPDYSLGFERTVGANDGILSDIEIARIQALNPVGKSLKGIEYLFAMQILVCRYMNLTDLDISGNSALSFVSCEGNKITELHTDNNLKLNKLICNSNDLKELNLDSNTALTELQCSFNELESLDVSKNTALTTLHCNNNHLTELDLSLNTAITQLECRNQKRKGLKVQKTSDGYEVDMKEYVSQLENIDADSITPEPISYNKDTGIITFSEPVSKLCYDYKTHSPNDDLMDVTIQNIMSVAILERGDFEDDNIISGMTPSMYTDYQGQELTEHAIALYDYAKYGKLGFAADGNSRLILRVQTDRPGYAVFSIDDDIGAELETLHREKLTSTSQVRTSQVSIPGNEEYSHQVSIVLAAPETFPQSKLEKFPSDKFTVHVKFYADDGETEEEDLELAIEAAPVLLVPGFGPLSAKNAFGDIGSDGVWGKLKSSGFNVDAWDHGGLRGPSEIFSRDYSGLFTILTKIFRKYYERKIVCTRADIVAHGMGGLLARRFCVPENIPEDGNYYSPCSYRQGMVRRIITIATPHRGTTWANYLLGDFARLNNSGVEPGLVYDLYLLFIGAGWLGRGAFLGASGLVNIISGSGNRSSYSAIKDMSVGSEVTGDYFPVNVPMHSIYNKTKEQLDLLLDAINNIISLSSLYKITYFNSMMRDYDVILRTCKKTDFIEWKGGAVTKETMEKIADQAASEAQQAIDDLPKSISITALQQATANKWLMAALHLGEGLLSLTNPLSGVPFATKLFIQMLEESLMFNEENDFVVTVSSAQGDFSGHSTEISKLNIFLYNHFKIAKREETGNRVVELLKGSASDFKVFETLTRPAVNSSAYNLLTSSAVTSDDEPQELNFSDIYDLRFTLNVEPALVTLPENSTAQVKFTAVTDTPTGQDFAYIVISHGDGDIIIPAVSKDENTFEVTVEVASEDFGVMKAYCFSCTEQEKLAISDTVQFTVNVDFDKSDIQELMFMNSSGALFVNAGEDIDINLYARKSDGRFLDVSSPLAGTNWTADAPEIAFAGDDGRVHGIKAGSTTLRAELNGFTAAISVDVGARYESADEEIDPAPEPSPVISSDPVPAPEPSPVISSDPVPVPEPSPVISSDPVPVPYTPAISGGSGGGCNTGTDWYILTAAGMIYIIIVKVRNKRIN